MDLYAYTQIEDLEEILKDIGLEIPRLRGIRLMKIDKPVSQEAIDAMIADTKLENAVQWLRQHEWDGWSSWKDNYDRPAFIYSKEKNDCGEYPVVAIDYSKIHGKDRKEIKFKDKKDIKAIHEQYALWNSFVGKDVLYVHARAGGGNRGWCRTNEFRNNPRYLGDCDDSYDSTYCDLYFDISDVDLSKYQNSTKKV